MLHSACSAVSPRQPAAILIACLLELHVGAHTPALHALQPGSFSVATAPPTAAEALQQRLLPLVCGDIDLVASLQPEVGLRFLPAHVTAASATCFL